MFDSPLRYPGGKGRLAQYVIDLMELNGLSGGHYVEPYAGGAGIAITLLYLEYASRIHLNDLNPAVYAFWKTVRDEPDALCKLIADTPISPDEWRRQRAVQSDPSSGTLALGFSTFFMNRTNRSGILTGGMIGGKEQTGAWKLDARYNREDLARRVEKIASYASRISLYNEDAAGFIETTLAGMPSKALVYFDPPYYEKGRKLYQNHYKHEDHARIAKLVGGVRQKWIVSYDNAEPIRQFYAGYEQEVFGLRYSAQERYQGAEVMVFCDGLERPTSVQPWRGIAA